MLIVSRIDMIFKGLFVIFAIATLGDIPSANKGIRINRSAAHTAPPKILCRDLAILQEVRHFLLFHEKFATEMTLQRYDFLSITFYVSLKMCTFANKIR